MLCSSDKCTGCGACAASCSVNAIQMVADKYGFYVPEIDEAVCVKCGKCSKACPILSDLPRKGICPQAWVSKLSDAAILRVSASGGMFTALANEIIKNDGTVFAAVWNDEKEVIYASAHNFEDLAPMRGSKYVQSFSADIFPRVKEVLQSGKEVLFVGVPCQVAGLYGYLGSKKYESLYTAEVVCHGGGSPKMLQDSIALREKKLGQKIVSINQTDKSQKPWSILIQKTVCIELADMNKIYCDSSEDEYLSLFLNGYTYREACYQCKFATMPRVADITLGDFFGFGTLRKRKIDTIGGVSQVIVNTDKGKALFERVNRSDSVVATKCSLYECMIYNHNLWKPSSKPVLHSELMEEYSTNGFASLADKYYNSKNQVKNRRLRQLLKRILGERFTALGMYFVYRLKKYDKRIKKILEQMEKQV